MEKDKKKQSKDHTTSRRKFLKTAAVAGAAAGSIGFPSVMRLSCSVQNFKGYPTVQTVLSYALRVESYEHFYVSNNTLFLCPIMQ